MDKHLPECRLSEPCDVDIAEHGFCSMQVEEQFFCIHCMGDCICERLRKARDRGYSEAMDDGWGEPIHIEEAVNAALGAVSQAIKALPAPYKMANDFETYGPYHEGNADFKSLAISVIDALREDS